MSKTTSRPHPFVKVFDTYMLRLQTLVADFEDLAWQIAEEYAEEGDTRLIDAVEDVDRVYCELDAIVDNHNWPTMKEQSNG